jgi:mitochondrial fission protein ELM1
MLCWGIAETVGMASQVRALALALGARLEMKTFAVGKPWDALPNIAYATPLGGMVFKRFIATSTDIEPPYPDLVISCGRRASMAALGLKRIIHNGKTKFIHIHHPCVPMKCFDLIVTVNHDHLQGPNVVQTRFALHSVTQTALAEARQHFAQRFSTYPAPMTSVFLGGTTNHYDFTAEAMAQIVMALQRMAGATAGSLLITPSRRTGTINNTMLRRVFASNARVYVYDEVEENPYMGMLALADTLVVTNDSVNMMSDAAATGKPVYILPLPGHKDTKQARFADGMIQDGIARTWAGKLESWQYDVSNEMERLAIEIKQRFGYF